MLMFRLCLCADGRYGIIHHARDKTAVVYSYSVTLQLSVRQKKLPLHPTTGNVNPSVVDEGEKYYSTYSSTPMNTALTLIALKGPETEQQLVAIYAWVYVIPVEQ